MDIRRYSKCSCKSVVRWTRTKSLFKICIRIRICICIRICSSVLLCNLLKEILRNITFVFLFWFFRWKTKQKYDGPEGSCYSTDFFATLIKFLLREKVFCYPNKIFVTQKSFFATLIKVLLSKKVFSASCFFSDPISKFFVSFIVLICIPIFLATRVILLQFFFFSFHLIYLCYSFFCFKCCFLCLFKALKVILLLIFFYFLGLLYINLVFSFQYVYQIFFAVLLIFFRFTVFCFCFFIATQLFSTSFMRFCYLFLFVSLLLATFFRCLLVM